MPSAAEYNYTTFPAPDDVDFFSCFFEHLKPGEQAPDAELYDLDSDAQVSLRDITTRSALTVIELGSLT